MINTKICTKCKRELEATLDNFCKRKKSKDNLNYWCKSCANLNSLQWEKDHQKITKERKRKWEKDHRETVNEQKRKYRKMNPKRTSNTNRKWYLANKEKANNKQKLWREKNPEKASRYWHVYKARKLSLPVNFTELDLIELKQKFCNRCAYCGNSNIPLTMDHIIPVSSPDYPGHINGNIVPVCQSCNSSKNNRQLEEWLADKFPYNHSSILLHIREILDVQQIDLHSIDGDVNDNAS